MTKGPFRLCTSMANESTICFMRLPTCTFLGVITGRHDLDRLELSLKVIGDKYRLHLSQDEYSICTVCLLPKQITQLQLPK